jgi:hypothetical protein
VSEQQTIRRQRLAILGLLIALVFTLVGFSVAQAVVDNTDGTANACYRTTNGKLRVATTPCRAGREVATTLNRSVPLYARVSASGGIVSQRHVTSAARTSPGVYIVTFDRDVSTCAYAVSAHNSSPGLRESSATSLVGLFGPSAIARVGVALGDSSGTFVDDAFSLTVTC